ncbi:MAG: RNA chaperone Hfq [Clostridia bacterium]|nr:RNA chaperone Hfq [Clostridia bacterium]
MTGGIKLQEYILNELRKNKTKVEVRLTNGYQILGTISGFDSFVIIIKSGDKQMVVYKHAISTITPERPVDLKLAE